MSITPLIYELIIRRCMRGCFLLGLRLSSRILVSSLEILRFFGLWYLVFGLRQASCYVLVTINTGEK